MHESFGESKLFADAGIPGASEGLIFPADKEDILRQAQHKHLPPQLIGDLEKIPDRTYKNIGDLIAEAVKFSK